MPRLSIDVTSQQHQQLKAIAALKGQSLKDFVLSRALEDAPDITEMTEQQALNSLSRFLDGRLKQAKQGKTVAIPRGKLLETLKARNTK